jgi:hypothetical protein
MIDYGFLLAVLFLLYLLECVAYIPVGSVAFRLPSSAKRRMRLLTKPQPALRSSLVFSLPFSVGSGIIVCSPLPISLCPQGIACNPRIASSGQREFIAFDDMQQIDSAQRNLLINGASFVTAASEIQAGEIREMLQRVKQQRLPERQAEIEREIARSVDVDRMCSRLAAYADKAWDLKVDLIALFVVIFLVSPIVVLKLGLATVWPFVIAVLLLNVALIAWDFRRINREVFQNANVPWQAIVMVLLSPPAALHATKYLARDLGRGYHPLALAAARCSDADFLNLAAWVLRDVRFAPEQETGGTDTRATDCRKWFYHKLQTGLYSLVRKKGFAADDLMGPPRRESEYVQSYCPRCLSQFVIREGVCTDCGRIPLNSFEVVRLNG